MDTAEDILRMSDYSVQPRREAQQVLADDGVVGFVHELSVDHLTDIIDQGALSETARAELYALLENALAANFGESQ